MPNLLPPQKGEKIIYPVFRTVREAESHMMEYADKVRTFPEFRGYGLYWEPRRVAGGFALVAAPLEKGKGKE